MHNIIKLASLLYCAPLYFLSTCYRSFFHYLTAIAVYVSRHWVFMCQFFFLLELHVLVVCSLFRYQKHTYAVWRHLQSVEIVRQWKWLPSTHSTHTHTHTVEVHNEKKTKLSVILLHLMSHAMHKSCHWKNISCRNAVQMQRKLLSTMSFFLSGFIVPCDYGCCLFAVHFIWG